MRTPWGVCALLALAMPLGAAPAPSVQARASRAEVTVGETFTVEVEASGPPGTVWTFPGEPGNEQVDVRTAVGASPAPPGTWRYDAAVFALGDVAVPRITVKYRLPDGTVGEAATEAIPLRLVSLVPKDEKDPRLADIRPPVPLRIGRAFWIAVGVLAVALLALAIWLWRQRRKPVAAAPATAAREIPAHVEAMRALDRLAASGLVEAGEHRAYYIALADVAKRYLERRLQAPVQEMTTAETLEWMAALPTTADQTTVMRDVAGAADRVKFARGTALGEEAARHLASVRSLVTEVERRLRPVPVAQKEVA
jgi:hypothetical protein